MGRNIDCVRVDLFRWVSLTDPLDRKDFKFIRNLINGGALYLFTLFDLFCIYCYLDDPNPTYGAFLFVLFPMIFLFFLISGELQGDLALFIYTRLFIRRWQPEILPLTIYNTKGGRKSQSKKVKRTTCLLDILIIILFISKTVDIYYNIKVFGIETILSKDLLLEVLYYHLFAIQIDCDVLRTIIAELIGQ